MIFLKIWKEIQVFLHWLETDIRGEYTFSVKGYEIIATFSEKPNNEILSRLHEILLGDSHIRQNSTLDIKLKKNIKEAV